MSRYPAGAMSDVIHGQDVEPEPPTLDELKRSHDWREEDRDYYEPGDGALYVLVCKQCGYERLGSRGGAVPDCEVREVPSNAIKHARRRGLIPKEGKQQAGQQASESS
jgi:hypothetical protein